MKIALEKRMLPSFLVRHIELVLLVAFALAGVWVLDDYGISTDEGVQRNLAVATLDQVFGDGGVHRWYYSDRFYGMAFELPLLLAERALGLEDSRDVFLMRHLVTHLFFLVGGFFCYLLAYRLFDNRLLALLAMLLFLLHPRLYAHSFFNTKDMPFLSMFMICLYLTHRAFDSRNIWRFIALGVATGILTNLRVMGLALFAAVLAMQLLDLLHADGNNGRKRALAGAAVFGLSTVLTLYVSIPYLWTDPIGRSTEWWATVSQFPNSVTQLFRGSIFRSFFVHPPEYVPVWFSITASPMVLVLGILGTLTVLRGGAVRLGDVFQNTRLRFGFMLIGCFVLPVLAVIVLSSNVYNGWRQMYFIYAPFCMLAAFGMHWVMSCVKGARWRAGAYSAVVAGVATAAVSMMSIHPHQHVYFNLLVDRTTPQHLRHTYDMDYWGPSLHEALDFLLERYPSSDMSIRVPNRFIGDLNWRLLPASDRSRVSMNDGAGDFLVTNYRDSWSSGGVLRDIPSSSIYDLNIYGSTVLTVADLSEVDDEVIDAYMDIYSRMTSDGDTLIRAEFDVHLDDDDLVYVKDDCSAADVELEFFLHMDYPPGSDVTSPEKSNRLRAERFNFDFYQHGVIQDGSCVAVVPVPGSTFSRISTGQWEPYLNENAWGAVYNATAPGKLDAFQEFMRNNDAEPAIRSVFDVHIDDGRLVYVKEHCTAEDRATRFFLHVHPASAADLPDERQEVGFENMDFILWEYGGEADEVCFAVVEMPEYVAARISTGQYTGDGRVWSGEYNVAAVDAVAAVRDLQERNIQPAARSVFDVYIDDGRVVYAKSPCTEEDHETRFFLHIYPMEVSDLPEERQELGFNNLGFNLWERGGESGGDCFAVVELPEYQIKSVSTGQFTADGRVWSAELEVGSE